MDYTTIQISKDTRKELNSLKAYPRQTYDELLTEIMSLIPVGDDEGKYTDEFRASMLRGLLDIRQGRGIPLKDLEKKLGIN